MPRSSVAPPPVLGHWDAFYQGGGGTLEPSSFAKYCASAVFPKFEKDAGPFQILDLGCGNGRDAEFFQSAGYNATGVDRSRVGIDRAFQASANAGPVFMAMDAADFIKTPSTFDVLYMRWFIHSIPPSLEASIYEWARLCLPDGGLIAIEARTISDRRYGQGDPLGENAFVDGHYRRFVEPHELMYQLVDGGFHLEHWSEGRKFAPLYGTGMSRDKFDEDPALVRVVASLNKRTAGATSPPDQLRRPPIVRKR